MSQTPSRSRRGGRFLILEMALIAFAVVLGFAVTNWGEVRRDRERARVAVERIRAELESNASGLSVAAPYYGTMTERLDSILDTVGDAIANDIAIPGWRGLSPPAIRRASFQVAMATGALENVDVATLGEIALAYELLGNFTDAIDHAMATLIAGDLRRVSEWGVVFSLLGELATISRTQATSTLEKLADG